MATPAAIAWAGDEECVGPHVKAAVGRGVHRCSDVVLRHAVAEECRPQQALEGRVVHVGEKLPIAKLHTANMKTSTDSVDAAANAAVTPHFGISPPLARPAAGAATRAWNAGAAGP